MKLARALTAALLCLLLAPAAWAQEADPLIGLWGTELNFSSLQGELTVRRNANQWTAAIADQRTNFSPVRSDIRFTFGGHGGFRGRMSADGRTIDGFWLRPLGVTQGYEFTTPISLRRTNDNEWRGIATPLDERFTLYLNIFRDQKDRLVAAFRNPERNSDGGAYRFMVKRQGDDIR